MSSLSEQITHLLSFIEICVIGSVNSIQLYFFSIWVFIHEHSRITGLQGKGVEHFINSSLPLPPSSRAFRHLPGDDCRELTSAHS